MDKNLNVAIAPKDSTFQVRINSDIKSFRGYLCKNRNDINRCI